MNKELEVKKSATPEKQLKKLSTETKLSVAQLSAIKSRFPRLTPEHILLYVYECQRKNVNIMDGVIVPLSFFNSKTQNYQVSFYSTIEYWRGKAEETGEYGGQSEATYLLADTRLVEASMLIPGNIPHIISATVGIFRKGIERPFLGTAMMKTYGKTTDLWVKMPEVMIAKCAEAAAFRKAFPKTFGSTYIPEETDKILEAEVVPHIGEGNNGANLEVSVVKEGFDGGASRDTSVPPKEQEPLPNPAVNQKEPELTIIQMIEKVAKEKGITEEKLKLAAYNVGILGAWRASSDQKKLKLLEVIRK